jgi:DNA-binding IclR family transcriptional regulator
VAPAEIRGRGIQSVEIGSQLLRVLAQASQPMMLRDLAAAALMPAGKAHTYLVSFRKLDLVEQDSTGRYQLGPFALRLGLAYLKGWPPYAIADEGIAGFADNLDLTAAITVWDGKGPTAVRIHGSSHQLYANFRPGTVFSLTNTATGKLYAALLPPARVAPLLKAETKMSVVGSKELLARVRAKFEVELAMIRKRKVATSEAQPVPGLNAISAPVFDRHGQMQVAITLMGPPAALQVRTNGRHVGALVGFTRDLSRRLGFAATT